MAADELRRRSVGDLVTYVVNRNINFTNVCIKRCGFCALSRDHRPEAGYFLPMPENIPWANEAVDLGAGQDPGQAARELAAALGQRHEDRRIARVAAHLQASPRRCTRIMEK